MYILGWGKRKSKKYRIIYLYCPTCIYSILNNILYRFLFCHPYIKEQGSGIIFARSSQVIILAQGFDSCSNGFSLVNM